MKTVLFFILQCSDDKTGLIEAIQVELLEKYTDKVAGIREILSRDRMKVAFFGR